MAEDEYKTVLPEATLKKAIEELGEDPKERAGQVQAFREWVLQQPHMKCDTDFHFLLRFLRIAKFSQLKARKRLETYLQIFEDHPQWFYNVDLKNEPRTLAFMKTGYGLILPGRDKFGRIMLMFNPTNIDVKSQDFTPDSALRSVMATLIYLMTIEDAQIHGITYLLDMTNFNMSHLTYWSVDKMKKITKCWQGRFTARMKGLNYYNPGTMFEAVMSIFIPLLNKKFQDRIVVLGSNLEEVYKIFPKESLPSEYLPDDYEGPCQGTYQEMTDKMIDNLTSPEINELIKKETTENIIERKNEPQRTEQASFRKLNVD